MRRALTIALTVLPGMAAALPLLVDNPQMMCGKPPEAYLLEDGMVLGSNYMETIEYFCEFDPAINFRWDVDTTTVARVGWCNEPGVITPVIFAFQFGQYEPGVVHVYFQERGEPQIFTACPE